MGFKAVAPDYTEKRNKKYLFFWGDYPHWLITNETGKKILCCLIKGADINDILDVYQKGVSRKGAKNDLQTFLKPLIETGIVYEKAPFIPSVKTQFSVETATKTIASVVINPTHACNYQCTHCYTDANTPLSDECTCDEMITILKQISPFMRPKILGFLGGEPLLRKTDVLTVAEYWIKKQEGYASVSTNGSLIDNDFAKKAAAMHLVVQISVDGAAPETCDAVRGGGSWEKAVKGAHTCVDHGVRTWLCMVYHKGNIGELEDFIALGKDIGVHGVRFIPYNYLGRGTSSKLVKVMPFAMVKRVHRILKAHPDWGDFIDQSFFGNISVIVKSAPRYVYCGSGLSTLLIESNGDLYPCINLVYPEFRVGNLKREKFTDLWFNSPILRKIRTLCVEDANPRCASCTVKYMCGMGCRSEIYELTRQLSLPTFFCASWIKAVYEMCWILDEFPGLHNRVTQQRQEWPSQKESLVDTEKAHILLNRCG